MSNATIPESDLFEATKARLQRILRRCGWTIHLRYKERRGGWYAGAAKRDAAGKWRGAYIAPLSHIDEMQTDEIVAILPPVA